MYIKPWSATPSLVQKKDDFPLSITLQANTHMTGEIKIQWLYRFGSI